MKNQEINFKVNRWIEPGEYGLHIVLDNVNLQKSVEHVFLNDRENGIWFEYAVVGFRKCLVRKIHQIINPGIFIAIFDSYEIKEMKSLEFDTITAIDSENLELFKLCDKTNRRHK